jgi:hypothetical protein
MSILRLVRKFALLGMLDLRRIAWLLIPSLVVVRRATSVVVLLPASTM